MRDGRGLSTSLCPAMVGREGALAQKMGDRWLSKQVKDSYSPKGTTLCLVKLYLQSEGRHSSSKKQHLCVSPSQAFLIDSLYLSHGISLMNIE